MVGDIEKGSSSDYIQFQEASVRNQFVRKVYTLLSIQLVVTFCGVWASCTIASFQAWLYNHSFGIMWLSLLGMIAFMVVSLCKPQLFVRYPHNFVLLALFTLCEALLLSSFTAFFEPRIVLTAIVYTAVVVFCLSLYAAKTSKDFISYQPIVLSLSLILILFGFTLMWIPFGTAIYSAIGACIFSFYLIMDTQLILGGKDRAQFGVDEYVYAAIMLYLDIINLFMYLLQLLSITNDRR